MASIRLDPPSQFDFFKPHEWPKWKRRFQQYRSAAGLATEDETRQVDTLLYCMGEEADSVLTSTNISADDRKKYTAVIGKFDDYFKVRRNAIFERAKFNRRSQREGESVEQYIAKLYELAEFVSTETSKRKCCAIDWWSAFATWPCPRRCKLKQASPWKEQKP